MNLTNEEKVKEIIEGLFDKISIKDELRDIAYYINIYGEAFYDMDNINMRDDFDFR